MVKVASPDEDVEGLRFQIDALRHVAECDPSLTVPHVRMTIAGKGISFIIDARGLV